MNDNHKVRALSAMNMLKEVVEVTLPVEGTTPIGPTDITRQLEIEETVIAATTKATEWSTSQIVYIILELLGKEGRAQRSKRDSGKWERTQS